MNLAGSYVVIRGNEAWLLNASIPPYQPANAPNTYDALRTRRLLLHKAEIKKLIGRTSEKGLTIVPLKVYNKKTRIKLLIGLARHKNIRDKRETIKRRQAQREIERTIKG